MGSGFHVLVVVGPVRIDGFRFVARDAERNVGLQHERRNGEQHKHQGDDRYHLEQVLENKNAMIKVWDMGVRCTRACCSIGGHSLNLVAV